MTLLRKRFPACVFLACLLCGLAMSPSGWAQKNKPAQWAPISEDEKALKEVPWSPGAPAVILYRESYYEDAMAYEDHYYRIKVLTEEGRKYGDVVIPLWKPTVSLSGFRWGTTVGNYWKWGWGDVALENLRARVVQPDGTVVEFTGQVFDKTVVKARGFKIKAKAFALPGVQPGSILEYQYTLRFEPNFVYPTVRWTLQEDLPIRRERLSLRPVFVGARVFSAATSGQTTYWGPGVLRWMYRLPPAVTPQQTEEGGVQVEMTNVPSLVKEAFMPPEDEMKFRVDLYYSFEQYQTPQQYWKSEWGEWSKEAEKFMGKRGAMEQAVAQTANPQDPLETKLGKLYARVQQLRNLSFESGKTEQEEERENLQENRNVGDVLKHGYGSRSELSRLFAALARAAGAESAVLRVSRRDRVFFNAGLPDWRQLSGEIAWVRVGDKEEYFDPGTPFCPFGLLPWERTGVQGLMSNRQPEGFVTTPQPSAEDARIERKASLKLEDDGTVTGTLELSLRGQVGLQWKLDAREEDEVGRQKELEEHVKNWLPSGAEVKLESAQGWQSSDEPLRAVFALKVPGLASSTGRRLLLPAGIFQGNALNPFKSSQRTQPLYIAYPYQEADDVTLLLPNQQEVESLPASRKEETGVGTYQLQVERQGGAVRVRREFLLKGYLYPPSNYSAVRAFYDAVRSSDDNQLVLRSVEPGQGQ